MVDEEGASSGAGALTARGHLAVAEEDQADASSSAGALIARGYLALGEDGLVTERGRHLLRDLWKQLDPERSLSPAVQAELNGFFASERQKLVDSPIDAWFWRRVCLPFWVDEQDLEEALHDLSPPKSERVRAFGFDLGTVLGLISPLGLSAVPRTRFQLVALAQLWRPLPPAKQEAEESPRRVSLPHKASSRRELLGEFFGRSWKLYVTLIVARYVPSVLRLFSLHAIVRMARRMRSRGLGWMKILLEIAIASYLTKRLDMYRRVMLHRIPMLTVRLHRKLRVKGYVLADTDSD